MKVSYHWLQTYFEKPLPDPKKIEEVLGLQAFEPEGMEKVGDDTVLDFDVLPNRAHDCLCHNGIAGEIATLFDLDLIATPRYKKPDITESDVTLSVDVQNSHHCRRFTTRVIENIAVKESPQWLKNRLAAIGQRSINTVVDATNYVMFDLGQPTHVFDYEKIDGKFVIRNAEDGEKITLLSGEEITLESHHLLVADEKKGLSLAGVKGGTAAEVNEKTTSIVIEAGNWDPSDTRKVARPLNLLTDAAKRFENNITPELTKEGIEMLTNLIVEIAGTSETTVGPISDHYSNPVKPWQVSVTTEQTNRLLGIHLSDEEVANILGKLRLPFTTKNGSFAVEIPHTRIDLTIAEDLIEEIGRVHGYNIIDAVVPEHDQLNIHKEFYYTAKIRSMLTEMGFSEVYTYTFTDHGTIEMTNAVASDKNFLRTNLHEGVSESLQKNLRNAELFGLDVINIFEIGTVYPKDQELHIALGSGSSNKKLIVDIPGIVERLGNKLGVTLKTKEHEGVHEINLSSVIDQLPGPTSYDDIPLVYTEDKKSFHPISSYPFVLRDIAVWLPDTTERSDLQAVIQNESGELLVRTPRLIDEYAKEGRTSYAHRLVFQSQEKTLSDTEVNEIMAKIEAKCAKNGWEVR